MNEYRSPSFAHEEGSQPVIEVEVVDQERSFMQEDDLRLTLYDSLIHPDYV